MAKHQVILGRFETIDVVGHALGVPAKIDTGAFRSSIHASNISIEKRGSREVLVFDILGHRFAPIARRMEAQEFRTLRVRSSNGTSGRRYVVQMKIKLATKTFTTTFSLSDRKDNIFPVLIGREALRRRFMVDVSRTTLSRMDLKKSIGISQSQFDEEDLED